MQVSVEISKYPLFEDFIPAVDDFIARLNQIEGITVLTNTMSTQVFGDYDLVTATINQAMKESFARYGKVVFTCKYLGRNLDPKLKPYG